MILLAAPAYAGSRVGGGFIGVHGGGFHGGDFHGGGFHNNGFHSGGFHGGGGFHAGFAFHNSGARARILAAQSAAFGGYGYGCGFGFNCGGYDGNSYAGVYNENGSGGVYSGNGSGGGVTGYASDPVGAEIPPMILHANCWVRRAAHDPSGAYMGQALINLCHPSDNVTVTGLKARAKTPETGTGQPAPLYR